MDSFGIPIILEGGEDVKNLYSVYGPTTDPKLQPIDI